MLGGAGWRMVVKKPVAYCGWEREVEGWGRFEGVMW